MQAASKCLLLTIPFYFLVLGCTDARLGLQQPKVAEVSSSSEFFLSTPKSDTGPKRYIFFVDQSFSMVGGHCQTDVNNETEPSEPPEFQVVSAKNPGMPCATKAANDPDFKRLKMIRSWLNELKGQPDTLAIIVPFSGGYMETRRRNTRTGGGPFGSGFIFEQRGFTLIDDNLVYLSNLESEHKTDLEAAVKGSGENKFMGTSSPASFLTMINATIYSDMKKLQESGQLLKARYHMIFLSDGVPTPTTAHVQTALNLKSCSHSCIALPSSSTCTSSCRSYTQDIYDFWGNPDENSFGNIRNKLLSILALPEFIGEGRVDLSLILINPENVESRNKTAKTNYLMDFRSTIPQARSLEWSKETPPFSLTGGSNSVVSHKLTALFALNPGFRLNKYGELRADTDGDGLFDSDELSLGFDPQQMRTNHVCLDSIEVQEAYKKRCVVSETNKSCLPWLDSDADGLNECEENILGTNPMDFDSDGDMIPDGLEMTYNYFVGRDDERLDSNSDNTVNLVNFAHNLMPHHYIERSQDALVRLRKEFTGIQVLRLLDGSTVQREGYAVHLDRSPVGDLGTFKEFPKLFMSRKKAPSTEILPETQVLGGSLAPSENVILFLARMVDSTDPNRASWLILKKNVRGKTSVSFSADLSTMLAIPARDPISPDEILRHRSNFRISTKAKGFPEVSP